MQDYGQSPFSEPAPWAAAPPPPPPPPRLFELRPLSLGEILDRTFALYRQRFWLYAGLATVVAGCSSLFTLVSLTMGFGTGFTPATAATPPDLLVRRGLGLLAAILVVAILYLIAYGITQAAIVAALSAVYVGEETSIGIALARVRGHWFRYVLIMLWQSWSGLWLPFLLMIPAIAFMAIPGTHLLGGLFIFLLVASLFYTPFAIIRNALGVVSSAVEDLPVRKAMRRSKVLVAGHKGRVLGIMLLVWVLSVVAGVLQQIFAMMALYSHGGIKVVLQALLLVVTFATIAMVTPVGPIALSLFYIDERVRKEGFDVEVLMSRGAPPPPSGPEALPSPYGSELA